ncbi:PREDICTED: nose resistant to fluoxetine protein 6-like, partial [Priapulus caudatus]|uniref:Nose resistant to fluoxetine protein 6-like n=1 Tax=Priapulus caudatus TaxID=37621 RepID=A0ABM1DQM1_PRICU
MAVRGVSNSTLQDRQISGKYCTVTLQAKNSSSISMPAGSSLVEGLCVPSTCSQEDVLQLVSSALALVPQIDVIAHNCPQPAPFDWRTVTAIVIIAVFVMMLLAGTGYDIAIQMQKSGYHAGAKIATTVQDGHNEYSPMTTENTHDQNQSIHREEGQQSNQCNSSGLCASILLSFSALSNSRKLLATHRSHGALDSVHGVRFLSMSWVILGHTYVFSASIWNNPIRFKDVIGAFGFQAIDNATFSVDSFFVLSGLLVGYLTLKEIKKNDGKVFWPLYYFHRFWRLTPVYMLLLMVDVCLVRYFGSGPLWPKDGFEVNYCSKTWWTNLLFINNLVYSDQMCMGWSWYLANDMQFFLISPLFLITLYKSRTAGFILMFAVLVGSCLSAGIATTVNGWPSNIPIGIMQNPKGFADMFRWVYITPWSRIQPYIIGLALGYVLFTTNCKVRLHKWVKIGGWLLAAVLNLLLVYGTYPSFHGNEWSDSLSGFYVAVSRTGWSLGLGWVIFICIIGQGGFVNTLLSWKALIPLSRLTYCAYLVHPVIIMTFYFSRRELLHWSSHCEMV